MFTFVLLSQLKIKDTASCLFDYDNKIKVNIKF